MTGLEPWIRAEALGFLLATARAGGVVVVAPLAWTTTPAQLRVALVLLIAVVGYAQSPRTASTQAVGLPLFVEFALGAVMGFVVRLAVASAEIAGEAIASLMGLGAAQWFDPGGDVSENVLARLLRYFAILVALSMGLHRVLVGALIASYRMLPVGASLEPIAATETVVRLTSQALEAGVQLAFPLMVVLFLTQVGLAFIARAAPAMQIFNVGFAVTIIVGAVMIVLLLPDLARGLVADMSSVEGRLEALLVRVGAAP